MDDSYSPWASNAHDDDYDTMAVPHSSMSFPTSSILTTSSTWSSANDDDGGGWGTTVDDMDVFPSTTNSITTSVDLQPENQDNEALPSSRMQPESPKTTSDGGWGHPADDLDIPTLERSPTPQAAAAALDNAVDLNESTPRASSPTQQDYVPGTTPPISPRRGSTTESDKSDGGWGVYGSPELPPISSLQLEDPSMAIHDGGDESTGWAGDSEWQPPDIPEPLPSFGDAFERSKPRRASTNSGEGWVDPETVSSWKPQEQENDIEPRHSRRASEDRGWDPEAVEQGGMSVCGQAISSGLWSMRRRSIFSLLVD